MTMRTTAFAALALAAWLAPTTSNASPINYNITISGGIPDCGIMRPLPPLSQPCDTVITGSILVDSEGTTFAEQYLGFSLDVIPGVTYTRDDTLRSSANSLQFDELGVLTGFNLPMIVRLDNTPPAFLTQWAVHLSANAEGGSYRFENRMEYYMYNGCRGCVAITATAVSEPGAGWLLIPAVALTLVMSRRRRPLAC